MRLIRWRAELILLCLLLVGPRTAASQEPAPPDLVIGRSDGAGAGALFFEGVEGVLPWSDDHLLVVEPAAALVRLLDLRTLEARRIGRRGRGPGEFESPRLAGGDDGFWIWDPALGRMTLFAPALDVTATVRLPALLGPVGLLGDRGFVGTRGAAARRSTAWLLLLASDGATVRDSLPLGEPVERLRIESGGFVHVTRQPWADHPIWAAAPVGGGFVVVERPTTGPPVVRGLRYDRTGRLARFRSDPPRPAGPAGATCP